MEHLIKFNMGVWTFYVSIIKFDINHDNDFNGDFFSFLFYYNWLVLHGNDLKINQSAEADRKVEISILNNIFFDWIM